MKNYKIIISGGGTGGHIYPAIAIADTLKAHNPQHEILFVGAEGKMETEKVPKAGYQLITLPIRGLQRKLTPKNLLVPFKLLQSLWKSQKILSDFQPDVVVGVGGYASAAVLRMAQLQRIPVIIQEQNSYAGLTNKWLSAFASKICVAYPNMEKYFPANKITLTGNPVRSDIIHVRQYKNRGLEFFGLDENRKTVFVFGGSLGARTLNNCFKKDVEKLLQEGYQVIWQTGKIYYPEMREFAEKLNDKHLVIKEFVYEMNLAYAVADVVISRAGALSVSELCLAEKATILVPSPNVAEDHQTKNAMALVEQEAALLVQDIEASEKLIPTTLELLKNTNLQQKLQQNIKVLAKPNAAEEIVQEILKFCS